MADLSWRERSWTESEGELLFQAVEGDLRTFAGRWSVLADDSAGVRLTLNLEDRYPGGRAPAGAGGDGGLCDGRAVQNHLLSHERDRRGSIRVSGTLLLLPLDDRPVNLDFPVLLARGVGERLLTPPPALLGRFLTPGEPDALGEWLLRAAENARALILSLDMLAYGGLVASRMPRVSVGDAIRRLALLREIRRRHPALHILAFNVIMRLTITGADAETRAAGRDIFRYSVLRDESERLGVAGAAAELRSVTARIPPALLQAYLQARARNHAVNRGALTLLREGVLDFLALVQEDTAPSGLHVCEQQALIALGARQCADERWRLYAGTDEAAQTLLARCLLQEAGQPFPVALPVSRCRGGAESGAL